MVEIKLTERELTCLISFMEVDEEILKEIIEENNYTDEDEYCIVVLNLLNKLRTIRGGIENETEIK